MMPARSLILVLVFVAVLPAASDGPIAWLSDPAIRESSGLAVSRRAPERFWTHNDHGNRPWLFACDHTGRVLDRITLAVPMGDWEDCAAVLHEGRSLLLIADTGDNDGQRPEVAIHILEEPDPTLPLPRHRLPVRTVRLRYPDRPQDVEALAVDPQDGRLLLIDKRKREPATVWAVDGVLTHTADDDPLLARRLTTIPARRVTAADIDATGRRLAVLAKDHILYWDRRLDEDWATVLQRPPRRLPLPPAREAEALAFSLDGASLYCTSELAKDEVDALTPLFRLPVPQP